MQLFTSRQENDSEKIPWKKPTEDRRGKDRRQTECEGFIYIPMVGWYCRRDHARRDGDIEDFEEGTDEKESK